MSVPCFLWSSTRFRYVFWLQILLRAKNFLMEEISDLRGDAATPTMEGMGRWPRWSLNLPNLRATIHLAHIDLAVLRGVLILTSD